MKNIPHHHAALFTAMTLCLALQGCQHLPDKLQDNDGSIFTSHEGQQLTEDMFLGKWDLDGQRTNEAKGEVGAQAIPSDVIKDIFGTGWHFDRNGILRTDTTLGNKPGAWKIKGKNTLAIRNGGEMDFTNYQAKFLDGFMYLKNSQNQWIVMEKNKFFGF